MKNVEKSFLENRNDDWLAQELRSEARKSAWDFDGRDYVRSQHEEHCDAREVKQQHETAHNYYREASKPKIQPTYRKPSKKSPAKAFSVLFTMMFILFFAIFALSIISDFFYFDFNMFEIIAFGMPLLFILFIAVFIISVIRSIKGERK